MRRFGWLLIVLLLAPVPAWSGEAPTRVQLGGLIKFDYTHRDRDSRSGVSAVDELGLSWVELDLSGQATRMTYRLEVVSASSIYPGPWGSPAPSASPAGGELGTVGIRQAMIDFFPGGRGPSDGSGFSGAGKVMVRVGTFFPAWGFYLSRPAGQWDFIDLPLIDVHPALAGLGLQNTGAQLTGQMGRDDVGLDSAWPETVTWNLFVVNGYFPYGWANRNAPSQSDSPTEDVGMGASLTVGQGPARIYGGYYYERFAVDVGGGPAPENRLARSWRAGFELRAAPGWLLVEATSLTINDYQLLTDGSLIDLTSWGLQAGAGISLPYGFELRGRYEWLDPNTADRDDTVALSLYDQLTRWSAGATWRFGEGRALLVDYVLPVEQGSRVDVWAGREGGRYQERDDNYLRVQLQLAF